MQTLFFKTANVVRQLTPQHKAFYDNEVNRIKGNYPQTMEGKFEFTKALAKIANRAMTRQKQAATRAIKRPKAAPKMYDTAKVVATKIVAPVPARAAARPKPNARAIALKKTRAEKFFTAVTIQKVKNNPALKNPTIALLQSKPQTIAVVNLIAALKNLPGIAPKTVAVPITTVTPREKAKEQQERDEQMAENTFDMVSENPELKEQAITNLKTKPQTPIVQQLIRDLQKIPVREEFPIIDNGPPPELPMLDEGEDEEKPPFDWAGIAVPLAIAFVPFLLS